MNSLIPQDELDYTGVQVQGSVFVGADAPYDSTLPYHMSDATYAEATANMITVCADALFYCVDNGRTYVMLPRRVAKPQPGRWVVGGRRLPFRSFVEALKQNIERETGHSISTSGMHDLGYFEFLWADTAQDTPAHVLTRVAAVEMPRHMRNFVQLDTDEYDPAVVEWFDYEHVMANLATLNLHPALKAMLKAFRYRGSDFQHQHSDARRSILEAVCRVNGRLVTRTTLIIVHQDAAVLGEHYHPNGDEHFLVLDGGGTLYLAPHTNVAGVTASPFQKGLHFTVPTGTEHTFVCQAGTVLQSTATWPFTNGATVACPLKDLVFDH